MMKITSVEFIKSATAPEHYPPESLPEVAFVGRSNVGKSSLINTLVNRKNLARTSSTPGHTQLINYFKVNERFFCVDLPGYGFAKVPLAVKKQWGPMVETYLRESRNLRAVILILDIRRDPSGDDFALIQWLNHYHVHTIFALTKSDKLSNNKLAVRRRAISEALDVPSGELVVFSARTGVGKSALWGAIRNAVQSERATLIAHESALT